MCCPGLHKYLLINISSPPGYKPLLSFSLPALSLATSVQSLSPPLLMHICSRTATPSPSLGPPYSAPDVDRSGPTPRSFCSHRLALPCPTRAVDSSMTSSFPTRTKTTRAFFEQVRKHMLKLSPSKTLLGSTDAELFSHYTSRADVRLNAD